MTVHESQFNLKKDLLGSKVLRIAGVYAATSSIVTPQPWVYSVLLNLRLKGLPSEMKLKSLIAEGSSLLITIRQL